MDNVITFPARPSAKVYATQFASALLDKQLKELRLKEAKRATKAARAGAKAYAVRTAAGASL